MKHYKKWRFFKGQNLIEFTECFKNDQDRKEYLSDIKWSEQYVCRKCKHTRSQIRKDFSRTCNICSDTESATANTLFHKVKFGLKKENQEEVMIAPRKRLYVLWNLRVKGK